MAHGLVLVDLLVGDDAHGAAADPRVAAEHGAAKLRLVFVELAAVDNARNHLAHVVDIACAGRRVQQAIHILGGKLRRIAHRVELTTAKNLWSSAGRSPIFATSERSRARQR